MKKRNDFNFKSEFKKSTDYLEKSKKFIYAVTIIFFSFVFIGFFIPTPPAIEQYLLELIEELVDQTEGMSFLELTNFIFLNNLRSSFLGIILGVFFGIIPIFYSVFNGYLIGFVAFISVAEGGVFVLWRILPHGIFELPAVFISLGLGLKLGTFIFQKNILKSFVDFFWNSLRVFLFIVLPLLIIAAIIETGLIFLLE